MITAAEKCCAFSGGTSRTPSPTVKNFRSSWWTQPVRIARPQGRGNLLEPCRSTNPLPGDRNGAVPLAMTFEVDSAFQLLIGILS